MRVRVHNERGVITINEPGHLHLAFGSEVPDVNEVMSPHIKSRVHIVDAVYPQK